MLHMTFNQVRVILREIQYPVEYPTSYDVLMGYAANRHQSLKAYQTFKAKGKSGTPWTEKNLFQ